MNALLIAFAIINTLACAITCWYALCGLNACTRKTPFTVRLSFAGIAIGSFAALLHPPEFDIGGAGTVLVFVGVAAAFWPTAASAFASTARRAAASASPRR